MAVVTLFLLVTAGTGLVDSLLPLPLPKLMGEEKFRDQRLRSHVRFVDGTAARLVERDCRLRSRVRRQVAQDYTFALFWLLNEAKETVVVGADKWLYLASRVHTFPDAHRRVAHTAARLAALNRRLSDKGIELVVVPIPRKSVIYRAHLPRGMDPRPELDRLFLTELSDRGVPAVDLLTPFTVHAPETLYFRNGAHWTPRAEVIAAEHVCREAEILVPPPLRLGHINSRGREPEDLDILRFLGLELSDTKTLREKRFRPFFADQTVTGYEVVAPPCDLTADGSPDHMKRISIFGTSFTAIRRFPGFVAHYAGEPVWNGAEPGGNVGRLMFSVLRDPRLVTPPEVLILEIPNCQVVREGPSRIGGELFALLQPASWSAIGDHDHFDVTHRMHDSVGYTATRRRIASLKPGFVAHSADGIVYIRLNGHVSGGSLVIEVNSNTGLMTVPWHANETELIVPIIGYAPSAEARIFATAIGVNGEPVTLQLHNIQVVTDLDHSTARTGRIGPVTKNGQGWVEEIRFDQGVLKNSGAALELQLEAMGPFSGSVGIRVTSGDGKRDEIVFPVKKIRRNGTILLNLGALEGSWLGSVRVQGSGRSPRRVVKLARIIQKRSRT